MKQTLLTLLLLAMITPCLKAQRKELSQARSYIKSRKNYDKAEQLMTKLLADTAMRHDKRIYQVWLEAVKGQYDQANERLYLRQNQDTTAFFNLTRRMFQIAFSLDTIDALPDRKGRIRLEYRSKHAAQLQTYRPNLYNGGTYHIRKASWQQGFDFMDAYIDCARQPLFSAYQYAENDSRLPEAAYWATYCAYRLQRPDITLRHATLALSDSAHANFALQFIAEAYRWMNDTLNYVQTLQQGFNKYPLFPYFFPRLIDAYTTTGQYDKALREADHALALCDTCELYLLAKSTTLLRMGHWQESLTYSQRIIMHNDSMAEAYFNASMACVSIADSITASRSDAKSYYQRARTYMEYYRQLMPTEQQKWAPVLYRIYLNLNLGRQFDEIDRLLREN